MSGKSVNHGNFENGNDLGKLSRNKEKRLGELLMRSREKDLYFFKFHHKREVLKPEKIITGEQL